MITNILMSVVVSLVTNVVNWDNHGGCEFYSWAHPAPGQMWINGGYHQFHEGCTPFVAATERYTKTEVSEVSTWTFHCPDKDRLLAETKLLSSVTATSRLKSEWELVGTYTNEVGWSWIGTNKIMFLTNLNFTIITNGL